MFDLSNPQWVLASLGVGGVISTVAVAVAAIRKMERILDLLRVRMHRRAQVEQFLINTMEQLWNRTVLKESAEPFPRLPPQEPE